MTPLQCFSGLDASLTDVPRLLHLSMRAIVSDKSGLDRCICWLDSHLVVSRILIKASASPASVVGVAPAIAATPVAGARPVIILHALRMPETYRSMFISLTSFRATFLTLVPGVTVIVHTPW